MASDSLNPVQAALSGERVLSAKDWAGFFTMVVGMFMALLDIQIVSSSLSELQAGLSASADEIAWVQSSYLIAEVVMIPLTGYLSRLLGTRVLFAISAAGFTIMSLAAAMAWSLNSMIVFRAAQGFIGGAMIPTVFATAFTLFPASRRAGVSVMVGLVATMAPTLGPTFGGYLTQSLSWHWLFLINLLPGIAVTSLVWLLVDIDKPDRSLLKRFDLPGFAAMAVFLGTLQYVLEEGPRHGWMSDSTIALFATVSIVAGLLFFWRVLTVKDPIVDLRAFADRNFAVGSLFSFVLGVGLYGSTYLIPAYLGRVRGFNSLEIGEMMAITGAFQFLSAPLAGFLSKKMDLRLMMALGFGLFGYGVYLNTQMTAEWGYSEFFLPSALRGISMMLCFLPINTLALGTISPAKLKNASGLYNLTRNLGGAMGLAAIGTVLSDRFQFHWNRLGASINPGHAPVQNFIDTMSSYYATVIPGDPTAAAMKQLGMIVAQQATVLSFSDCMLLMAGVFGFALLLMPLIRKPQQAPVGAH